VRGPSDFHPIIATITTTTTMIIVATAGLTFFFTVFYSLG
jgi:hypothetical protein